MNEFFSSTLWAQLKEGKTPELQVATSVYVWFGITAVTAGLIIIIAAKYYK